MSVVRPGENEPLLYQENISDGGSYGVDQYTILTHTSILDTNELQQKQIEVQRMGVHSVVLMLFNRIVGTAIFALPSNVVRLSGSVGLSLIMWIVGAAFAAAGMQVYIAWGKALPFNGGEKNYLTHMFPKPPHLITCLYAAQVVLVAHGGASSTVFAEYGLAAFFPSALKSTAPIPPQTWLTVACFLTAVLLHGVSPSAGIKVQNSLGIFKIAVLFALSCTGMMAFSGHLQEGVPTPKNFADWDHVWEGTRLGISPFCAALYSTVWSYTGYQSANASLSEIRNPGRTLQIAGNLAILLVAVFYILCNLAYFAAIPKEDIAGSGRLVVALLVRNVWGSRAERVVSAFISFSAFGNVLATAFSFSRINQVLARDGILPFRSVVASNWPSQAPLGGLALWSFVAATTVLSTPPGDMYTLLYNLTSYTQGMVQVVVAWGLLFIILRRSRPSNSAEQLKLSTTRTLVVSAILFACANLFVLIVPIFPPAPGANPYMKLPYWSHVAGGWGIFSLGALWWLIRFGR